MMPGGGLAAALLVLAAPAPAATLPAAPTAVPALPERFAPPLGQPMTYRVTTRRLTRERGLASYTLVYALQWDRVGRGVQLVATLNGIESDARPELAGALAKLLAPLVGVPMTYLVAPDGSRIDLVDPDALWQKVLGRMQDMAATAAQPEAKQMAGLLAALPPAERDKLATADIRALVAQANDAIPQNPADGVTIGQQGALRTVVQSEQAAIAASATQPLTIETVWTIDTATGLVLREQRQNRIAPAEGGAATLVEERIRMLSMADPR